MATVPRTRMKVKIPTLRKERARVGHPRVPVPINEPGRFGAYGGRYVPETLMAALEELEREYEKAKRDPKFQRRLEELLRTYAGRPTALTFARRLSEKLGGAKIYLKREDLLHTGAHKINNCLGQALLVERMGKRRVIAETGAGQHAAAGVECVPHAVAGSRGAWSGVWIADVEGCHQRGDAGLGDERAYDALLVGERAGGTSVSDDGAGFSSRDREGGAGADFEGRGKIADCGDCLRGRGIECDRNFLRVYKG